MPPIPGSWDVLVNTVPYHAEGLAGHPMHEQPLTGEIVFDLIYGFEETPLNTRARSEGCLVIGGLEMLVCQAERQFEIWTGQAPPRGLFREAAQAALGAGRG